MITKVITTLKFNMKKLLLFVAIAATSLVANAEERGFWGNKFFDNWYIGISGGVNTKTTDHTLLQNLNPNAGLRIGKWLTPAVGLAVEGYANFTNEFHSMKVTQGTVVKHSDINILATFNLMNCFAHYPEVGGPRRFEVYFVPGIGWGHSYGEPNQAIGTSLNFLTSKLALDFVFNLGKKKAWQIFVEPSINYCIDGAVPNVIEEGVGNKVVKYHINASFLQLNAGIAYKFKTSNTTHNFAVIRPCQEDIDGMRNQINTLQAQLNDKANEAQRLHDEVEAIKKQLEECENRVPDTIVASEPEVVPNLPAVFYQCNKSIITPSQMQNVIIAAEVLKNHPNLKIQIKGYASPEGPHDNNTSLGIRRANAVRDMLIKKYGISPSRITAEGCGETDKLFEVYEFNRVAMLYLEK